MGTPFKAVIATRNADKAREIAAILSPDFFELLTLADFPRAPEVVEDGATFEENALKKARSAAEFTSLPALADDTGLEVDALGGAPGVFSARYAGDNCSSAANNRKLLAALSGVPPAKRGARFRCVMAVVWPNGKSLVSGAFLEGAVTGRARGGNGFGYDCVFEVCGSGKTLAEMSPGEKNIISHRAMALRAMSELLRGL